MVTNERERDRSQVSYVRLLLRRVRTYVLMSTAMQSGDPPSSLLGHPAFPFIDEGEEQVTQRERGRRAKERKASRTAGPFFSFMRVPPTLQIVTGTAPRRAPVRR